MNLYLREISNNDKYQLLDMVCEIENDTIEDKFEGFGIIRDLNEDNFDSFLEKLERNKNIKLYKPNYVDQTTYVLVDDDNYIYGGVNIRHELNDALLIHGGHIGYFIRPSERKKGYGNIILKEALLKCKLHGIDKVLVTCREDNTGSSKVIENNGGVYENSIIENQKVYKRYWINNK